MDDHQADDAEDDGADRPHHIVLQLEDQAEEDRPEDQEEVRQPAGQRRPTTFGKNLPFIREIFGSIASMKPGRADGQRRDEAHLRARHRVRQGEDERDDRQGEGEDILHEEERGRALDVVYDAPPSATTEGIAAKFDSSRTMCETWLAASEPEAIATEQSASLSARTSFTPSPVMATVWPPALRARTKPLLVRRNTAEDGIPLDGLGYVLIRFQRAGIHVVFSAPYPGALGDLGDGQRVVPEMTFIATPCAAK